MAVVPLMVISLPLPGIDMRRAYAAISGSDDGLAGVFVFGVRWEKAVVMNVSRIMAKHAVGVLVAIYVSKMNLRG